MATTFTCYGDSDWDTANGGLGISKSHGERPQLAYAVEKLGGGQRFPSDPDWSEVFLIGADPGLSV